MYLLAIFLPPVAVLMTGKPMQALLNLFLWFFLWVPASIHAVLVVNDKKKSEMLQQQIRINDMRYK